MKFKNKLLVNLLLILALTSCGSNKSLQNSSYDNMKSEEASEQEISDTTEEATDNIGDSFDISGQIEENNQIKDRKIEYFYEYTIETTTYDDDYKKLNELTSKYKGYIDSSDFYMDRRNDDKIDLRSYQVVIKIPRDTSAGFAKDLTKIGKINNISQSSNDLTKDYKDVNLRLETKKKELDKLNQLMEKSKNIEETMAISQRILEVESEIDQINSNLRDLDQRVAYNTFTIFLREVYDYNDISKNNPRFGERIAEAFGNSVGIFLNSIMDLLVIMVSYWPILVILIVIIILIVRFRKKKNKTKKSEKISKDLPNNLD
ncbi:DUF4349 domain-containing protein [Anaerococcus sp. Marseille-P9784]|uniref:DUF4349 domain-containing protein n=1 Tax=Anaerococcus sp. Marseille-P9784 TaxID=2614127 RepID=UPI00124A7554|nr:DUF4349 domain-containing protein [Anaerococcus sp. Marseille-P9784]